VTRNSLRLDSSGLTAAIALAVFATLANGVWLLLDHSNPSWDQARYLSTALQYKDAFHIGGPIELLHSIDRADSSHGPLFTIALLPALSIFGTSNSSGLVVNLVAAPVLYLAAGEIAYALFRNGFARLLTIFLVATTPILVGLFHNVLQEFMLTTLATLSLLLLLRSDLFQRRWTTWGMGFAMGLGTLTKVTFPAFVIGPFLVVLAQAVLAWTGRNPEAQRRDWRPAAFNLGVAALVLLVVAGLWYGPNLSPTLDYIRSTTSGPLAEGAGPKDPITFHNIASFTLGVISFNLSWVILLLGVVAAILSWPRLRLLFRRPIDPGPWWKLAFLLAWAVVPYLSVALAHNQDVRLMAPSLPAVAILVAGAVSAIPKPRWRLALAGIAIVVLGYQTLTHIIDVTPGWMPDRARISASSYEAKVQLNSEPIGYERLPGDDYVTPIFEYIEAVVAREGREPGTGTICLLESEPLINSNTFGFTSAARRDTFGFADIVQEPGGTAAGLEETLSGCNFALYAKPPTPGSSGDRLTLVNEPFAANHMTKSMFRLFQGPTKVFPVAHTSNNEGERDFQGSAGGSWVRVLTRTPEAG
jgi:4-amino-4-deoxy-L-arabinose transferase-like glycosyltransferase